MEKVINDTLLQSYYDYYHLDEIVTVSIKEELLLLKFGRGEKICVEGEEMPYLMFLVEGKVKVFLTLANGKSLLASFYTPFQIIGDIELIKSRPTSGTVEALKTCYILALPMEKARSLLLNDATFLAFSCSLLGEKLHDMSSNSAINLLYSLENRLARYILLTATPYIKDEEIDILLFDENLTHLAELLGTSYRHLMRTIRHFCEMGVLLRSTSGYEVIDLKALKTLAEAIDEYLSL